MASMVTIQPFMANTSNSFGRTVISFDLMLIQNNPSDYQYDDVNLDAFALKKSKS